MHTKRGQLIDNDDIPRITEHQLELLEEIRDLLKIISEK